MKRDQVTAWILPSGSQLHHHHPRVQQGSRLQLNAISKVRDARSIGRAAAAPPVCQANIAQALHQAQEPCQCGRRQTHSPAALETMAPAIANRKCSGASRRHGVVPIHWGSLPVPGAMVDRCTILRLCLRVPDGHRSCGELPEEDCREDECASRHNVPCSAPGALLPIGAPAATMQS